MKLTIILNGISRKKKKFYNEIFPVISSHFAIDILETRYGGHAEELASAAAHQTDCILAAGGDGTLHQVINGVMKNATGDLPWIGLIPLGSANDFARTCSLLPDPAQIIRLLQSGQPRPTDIGHIACIDKSGQAISRYFINVCSLGMGPEVVNRLRKSREWGSALSYFGSILSTFIVHRPQHVQCKTLSWEWNGKVRVLAFANGKSFGNALYVAPDAMLDDGVFHSFIAGDVPLWKFLLYLQTIKNKKRISDPRINYNSTASAELSANGSSPLEADGEIVGLLPATINILPARINFLR